MLGISGPQKPLHAWRERQQHSYQGSPYVSVRPPGGVGLCHPVAVEFCRANGRGSRLRGRDEAFGEALEEVVLRCAESFCEERGKIPVYSLLRIADTQWQHTANDNAR